MIGLMHKKDDRPDELNKWARQADLTHGQDRRT